MRNGSLYVVLAAALFTGGCGGNYYRVTDPSTGNVYYTQDVKNKSGGAVIIKDAATGDMVTLQNSHVTKVSKETYETNRAGATSH
jgi:hypothetical protein